MPSATTGPPRPGRGAQRVVHGDGDLRKVRAEILVDDGFEAGDADKGWDERADLDEPLPSGVEVGAVKVVVVEACDGLGAGEANAVDEPLNVCGGRPPQQVVGCGRIGGRCRS